jgi:hypothetical protein
MENAYTSSRIRNVTADLIKHNDDNLEISDPGYDTGYIEGVHDGLIDLLNELGIIHNFQYMNY